MKPENVLEQVLSDFFCRELSGSGCELSLQGLTWFPSATFRGGSLQKGLGHEEGLTNQLMG